MQIPPFWRIFGQKINSCESTKYHTFLFQAVLLFPLGNTSNNQLSLANPRDPLYHGERAANK